MAHGYLAMLRRRRPDYDNPERLNVILPQDLRDQIRLLVKYWNAEGRVCRRGRPRVSRTHVIRIALERMFQDREVRALLATASETIDPTDKDSKVEQDVAASLGVKRTDNSVEVECQPRRGCRWR